MSKLINEINNVLGDTQPDLNTIIELEEKLIVEYNLITKDYRNLFEKMCEKKKMLQEETIANCVHNYIRYSDYHNERYFICDKCGHEK